MTQIKKSRVLISVLLFAVAVGAACSTGPADGYRKLYTAVKSKNTDAIKARMTAKTLSFAEMAAKRNNTPIEKVLENGFTATTFAENPPEVRDERINENMGAVEVWNAADRRWEDLPFILENGEWKLAIGDLFAGGYKSPGKGQAMREAAAANKTAAPNLPPPPAADQNPNPQ